MPYYVQQLHNVHMQCKVLNDLGQLCSVGWVWNGSSTVVYLKKNVLPKEVCIQEVGDQNLHDYEVAKLVQN
jgi:hypothetical protein